MLWSAWSDRKDAAIGMVTEYMEKFMSFLAHNDPLSTTKQVQLLTSGLTDLLRVDVEMQKLVDLQVAMSLACANEQRAAIIEESSSEKSSMPTGHRTAARYAFDWSSSSWGRMGAPLIGSHRDGRNKGEVLGPGIRTMQICYVH